MNLAIEILQEEEFVGEDDVLCYAKFFSPSTWVLSELHQFFINKQQLIPSLANKFQQLFDVPEDKVEVYKFLGNPSWYCRFELKTENFYRLSNSQYSDCKLTNYPLFVNFDCVFFIVKNVDEEFRLLSEEEFKKYSKKPGFDNNNQSQSDWQSKRFKEKSIQIQVKKKSQKTNEELKEGTQEETKEEKKEETQEETKEGENVENQQSNENQAQQNYQESDKLQ